MCLLGGGGGVGDGGGGGLWRGGDVHPYIDRCLLVVDMATTVVGSE